MPQVNVIRWRDGEGWIILAGSSAESTEEALDIAAQALGQNRLHEPVAYVWAAGDEDSADRHLDLLEDLGAPTGFLVDILTQDDETIRRQVEEAGMVILGDGPDVERLRSALQGAASEGIAAVHDRGGVILGLGAGAAVLGSIVNGGGRGLGWIEGAAIIPRHEDAGQSQRLRALLGEYPDAIGLGIGSDSALALGPDGQVEPWGAGRITVALGRDVR
ncbi:MAG: hypothetical protein IT323_20715 [Anaerolineae bacterium]|nr:hypothetical protein [Anaerolineae bacterium]